MTPPLPNSVIINPDPWYDSFLFSSVTVKLKITSRIKNVIGVWRGEGGGIPPNHRVLILLRIFNSLRIHATDQYPRTLMVRTEKLAQIAFQIRTICFHHSDGKECISWRRGYCSGCRTCTTHRPTCTDRKSVKSWNTSAENLWCSSCSLNTGYQKKISLISWVWMWSSPCPPHIYI